MMLESEKIEGSICEVLESNPRGMTISSVARKLSLSRNTVSKYLDVMLTKGFVSMRSIGSAKLYSVSHRVPITSIMDASSDMIGVVDSNLLVVQGNEGFSNLMQIDKNHIAGANFRHSILFNDDLKTKLTDVFRGSNMHTEIHTESEDGSKYYALDLLPINLANNAPGACIIAEDITEKRLIIEALSASEKKHRSLINAIGDAIFIADENDNILEIYANEYASYPVDQNNLIGMRISDFVKKKDASRILAAVDEVRKLKEKRSVEISVEIEGSPYWFCASITPHEESGKIVALVRNITKRKIAEQNLQKSEERYRMLFDNIGDVAFVTKFEGQFLKANNTALEVYGYSIEELRQMTPEDLETPQSRVPLQSRSEKFDSEGRQFFEVEHITKNGKIIPFEVNIKRINLDGIDAVLCIQRDISKRKETEYALRDSEEKYKSIFNNISDIVFVISKEETFFEVNDTAVKHLGFTRDEFAQMDIYDIDARCTKPESRDEFQKYIKNLESGPIIFESEYITKDGRMIPVEIHSSFVSFQDVPAILSIAREITQPRELERCASKR